MAYSQGLWAKYYNYAISQTLNKAFFDNLPTPLAERAESVIDHGDGTTGSPQFNYPQQFTVDNDYGAIKFEGHIKAPITGTVRLYLQVADDEWAGLFLNGSTTETLEKPDHVNNPNEVWVDVQMTQNEYIPFVLKYIEFSGNNLTKLSWSYAGQAKQVIPASAYYNYIEVAEPPIINASSPFSLATAYNDGIPFTIQSASLSTLIFDANDNQVNETDGGAVGDQLSFIVSEAGVYRLKSVTANDISDYSLPITVVKTPLAISSPTKASQPMNFYDNVQSIYVQSQNAWQFELWKDDVFVGIIDESNDTTYSPQTVGIYKLRAISEVSEPSPFLSFEVFEMPAPNVTISNNGTSSVSVLIERTKPFVNTIGIYKLVNGSFEYQTQINLDSNGTKTISYNQVSQTGEYKYVQIQDGASGNPAVPTAQQINVIAFVAPQPLPSIGLDIPRPAWNDPQGDLRSIGMGYGSSPQPFYDLWFDYGYIMEVYKNDQLYLKYDITDGDTASSTGVYTTELLNNAGSTGSAGAKHDDGSFRFVAGAGDYGTYKFRLQKRTGNFEEYSNYSANFVYSAPASSALPVVTTASPTLTEQTINGTGVAGSWIKVYKENVFAFQVQVNGSGAWSITPQTSGNYKFSQVETGKPESAQTAVSVVNQSQSPMPLIENTAPFYVDMIISGQAINDTVVKVYKDGVYLETLMQASDGSFGFIPTSTGSYQFTRTDTDRTESEKTNAIAVTNAPLLVSAVPVVSTSSPQFTGTAIAGTGVAGATIKIYKNGVHLTSVVVNGSGGWSYTTTSDGAYTFSQTESGKTESGQTSQFTVNAVLVAPPAPAITSGLNGQIGTLITGTISQAGTVLVFKNGTQVASIPNQTTGFSYSPTSDGAYTFKLSNGNGTSQPSNSVVVPLTYEYEAIFNDTCGNPLEYAVSQTISDVTSSSLVWQSSKFFQVGAGTQYNLHAREIADHSKTKSVVVTTLP